VVTREADCDILDTAVDTIESTQLVDYEAIDPTGKSVRTLKMKVKLKTEKQLQQEEKSVEKNRLGKLSEVEYPDSLIDAKTVDFQPFIEGPNRDPQPVYPNTIDLDSPFAILSLFWTKEMWQILATNTNAYAIRQGAVERGRDHTGARQHHDNETMNQRVWWPTNPHELKVFVGALIYMGLHPEGETANYWYRDIFSGPNHTPALWMKQDRFTQIQRFLHCSPEDTEDIKAHTSKELDKMTAAERRSTNQRWWRKMEPLISMFR